MQTLFKSQQQSYPTMDVSTPPRRFIPSSTVSSPSFPFTMSLCRSKNTFYKQHEKLSRVKTPFHPLHLEMEGQVDDKVYLKSMNVKMEAQQVEQHQKMSEEFGQLVCQLLEPPKISNTQPNRIEVSQLSTKLVKELVIFQNLDLQSQQKQKNQVLAQGEQARTQNNINKYKHRYYYKDEENTQPQLIPNTQIPLFHLSPNSFYSLSAPLPKLVVETYKKYQTTKQPHKQINFSQGYLHKIDVIYYAVEKTLILHFPIGPGIHKNQEEGHSISMQLLSILYGILQTGINLKTFKSFISPQFMNKSLNNMEQDGQILIMCYPYSIQLCYLTYNKPTNYGISSMSVSKNPIHKLNMRYNLPNYSQPFSLALHGHYIYYLADQENLNLSVLNLRTGEISSQSTQNIYKSSTSQIKSIPSSRHTAFANSFDPNIPHKQKISIMMSKLGRYLSEKVTYSLLHPQENNWLCKLSQRYCTDKKVYKMIRRSCQHRIMIVCALQTKLDQLMSKFINKAKNIDKENNNDNNFHGVHKVVRIYRKQLKPYRKDNEQVWNYEDISYADNEQILDILMENSNNEKQNKNQCSCSAELTVVVKTDKGVQKHYYNTLYDSQHKNEQIFSQKVLIEHMHCSKILLSDSNKFKQNKFQCIKYIKTSQLLILNDNNQSRFSLNLPSLPSESKQQYLYTTSKDENNIITQCTDIGYTRVINITNIDYIYSMIKNIVKNAANQEKLREIAEYILMNVIYRYQIQNEEKNQNNQYILSAISQLFINLITLSTFSTHNNLQHRFYQMYVKHINPLLQHTQIKTTNIQYEISDYAQKLLIYYSQYLPDILIEYNKEIKGKMIRTPYNLNNILQMVQSSNSIQEATQQPNIPTQQQNEQVFHSFPGQQNEQDKQQGNKSQQNHQQSRIKLLEIFKLTSHPYENGNQFEDNMIKSQQKIIIEIILDAAIANNLKKILQPIWNMKIRNLNTNLCEIVLDKLDKISQIINSCVISIRNKNNQLCIEDKCKGMSPSTLTNSNYICNQDLLQVNSKHKAFISKLEELLIVTQLINQRCPNKFTFKQAFYSQPYTFAPFLFAQFGKDYDRELLEQWDKLIPNYINATYQEKTPLISEMSLRFWLQAYEEISAINNRTKIVKLVKNKVKNSEFIRQKEIKDLKMEKKDQIYPNILIPEFFIDYLLHEKGVAFIDLKFKYPQSDLNNAKQMTKNGDNILQAIRSRHQTKQKQLYKSQYDKCGQLRTKSTSQPADSESQSIQTKPNNKYAHHVCSTIRQERQGMRKKKNIGIDLTQIIKPTENNS